MPPLTTQGVVLRFSNYRDHDRMLTILSPEHGRLDALSRGCRRPKSPLLPASELFVHGEFVLYASNDRYTVTSCALTDTFYPLRLDAERLTCASYMLGLCLAAAQPGESGRELYGLLLKGLYHLAYCEKGPSLGVTASFLLLFSDVIGYRPRMNHCAHCRKALDASRGALLDVSAGGLVCEDCGVRTGYRLDAEQVKWMQNALGNKELETGEPSKIDVSEMFSILRRYIESHLEMPIKAGKLLP